ncbi:MAG: 1-acyl-sn-glycerol-3-phosphate acyltransferase [Spirochaetaceae bacterium]|jgi:1-acyl-sn-glycerol-3-phosphate acyltransferase|nr:1-acyl-sn-glycerol-3-phosphate acyltransferase [Spirochaetaceae bacterium]
MALIKTMMLFTLVGLSTVVLMPFGILAVILNLVGLQRFTSLGIYKIAQGWGLMLIKLVGCKLTVTGREHIIKKGGLCFVSNHGSIFDIVLILALTGRPVGFIAKKELAWIPFLNLWILLIGGFFIDRKTDRKSIKRAIATINAGVRRIESGGAMIIFPEGTRSKGKGLLPFRPGALKLATQARAPIIPMTITGSYDVFERDGVVRRVPVRVAFEKPIITAELPPEDLRKNLADQIRGVMEAALERGAENGPIID